MPDSCNSRFSADGWQAASINTATAAHGSRANVPFQFRVTIAGPLP
jgi:hypothetical protein